MRRVSFIGLSLFAGLALAMTSPPAAAGSFRVSPLLVMETAEPGKVLTDRLVVTNPSDEPAFVSVSPRDFTTNAEGQETWLDYGSHASTLKEWISFAPSHLEIPPGGEGYIDFEIRVPEAAAGDATPRGSRWSALAIKADRGRRPIAEDPSPATGAEVGVKVSLVYAVKIFVGVTGTEAPVLEAVGIASAKQPGSLVATFANRGNVVLRPRVWMEVRSVEGAVLGSIEALKWTLPPKVEHRYRFALKDLQTPLDDGEYQVVVIADYNGEGLEGVSAPLVLRNSSEGP